MCSASRRLAGFSQSLILPSTRPLHKSPALHPAIRRPLSENGLNRCSDRISTGKEIRIAKRAPRNGPVDSVMAGADARWRWLRCSRKPWSGAVRPAIQIRTRRRRIEQRPADARHVFLNLLRRAMALLAQACPPRPQRSRVGQTWDVPHVCESIITYSFPRIGSATISQDDRQASDNRRAPQWERI